MPVELRVLAAPFAVQTSFRDEVQPDVLVTRYDDLTEKNLPVAPVLVAEVASPSTALHDRHTKQAHYERLGIASYWVLDPQTPGALEVLELVDGRYESRARLVGDETVSVDRPFPVTVSPARLLEGLRRS